MVSHTTKNSIFDDLGFSPAEAENLKIRAMLMRALDTYIDEHKLTQAQAAKLFSVSQPRISDLTRGKIQNFTIDILVNMLFRAGIHVSIKLDEDLAA